MVHAFPLIPFFLVAPKFWGVCKCPGIVWDHTWTLGITYLSFRTSLVVVFRICAHWYLLPPWCVCLSFSSSWSMRDALCLLYLSQEVSSGLMESLCLSLWHEWENDYSRSILSSLGILGVNLGSLCQETCQTHALVFHCRCNKYLQT